MLLCRLVLILNVALIALLSAAPAGAWPRRTGQRVRVRFLATSTLIRGTFGQNEDTYLAQLLLPKANEAVLIRLIDAYANETPSISRTVLTSDAGTLLRVGRDAACDRPFGEILLRTVPGDPMALLPGQLSYRPSLQITPPHGMILPCYRVMRR